MIQAHGISKWRDEKCLLSPMDASFDPGSLNIILGPNGAGKSTLMHILTRELSSDTGEVSYGDRPLIDFTDNELSRIRAVLLQQTQMSFDFSVEEVVMLGRIPHIKGWGSREDYGVCENALAAVEMSAFRQRRYSSLSGGEVQRLHLARILAQLDPWNKSSNAAASKWLFLDEPTSALDLRHQHSIIRLVKSFAREYQIGTIAVLHDVNLAMRYADRVWLMNEGRLIASGDPLEVLTAENISKVYQVEATRSEIPGESRPFLHIHLGDNV